MYSTVYLAQWIDVLLSLELQNAHIMQKVSSARKYDKKARLINDLVQFIFVNLCIFSYVFTLLPSRIAYRTWLCTTEMMPGEIYQSRYFYTANFGLIC